MSTYSIYNDRYEKRKGGTRGRMSGKSLDIARTVLMEPDLSYELIAGRFGVSRQRVGQIVVRMGVARNRINEMRRSLNIPGGGEDGEEE